MTPINDILACPACHAPLTTEGNTAWCNNSHCQSRPRLWPVVQGIPILLDESRSLFRIDDYRHGPPSPNRHPRWRRWFSKVWFARPGLSRNVAAKRNYQRLANLLRAQPPSIVLVVGCGDEGFGIEALKTEQITLVGIDIRWTNSVTILGDAEQLPFADALFDAVILQGVLEHVFDPFQVEKEVFRTLKMGGLVYSELPFLQPNHGGAFDLTRFTYVGHRRFWRNFEQLDAGACCGPGMALAQVIGQFARALLPFRRGYIVSDWLTDWLFWWLKYLDSWLVHHPAGLDGASAFFFLGKKSAQPLSDEELIKSYRGAQ